MAYFCLAQFTSITKIERGAIRKLEVNVFEVAFTKLYAIFFVNTSIENMNIYIFRQCAISCCTQPTAISMDK